MGEMSKVTVSVYTRHSENCKDADRGGTWKKCNCPKWLYVYDGGGMGKSKRFSAKTSNWEQAEEEAVRIRRSFDPAVRELAAMKAQTLSTDTLILDALRMCYDDLKASNRVTGTIKNYRSYLGDIKEDGRAIGSLMRWLDKRNRGKKERDQILTLRQLNTRIITEWRGSWSYNDASARAVWQTCRGFWKWCVGQNLLTEDPTKGIAGIKVRRGNRCGMFSETQMRDILEAANKYMPTNLSRTHRALVPARVHAFVLLMRWSGMAIIDAVAFRRSSIDDDDILRYRRIKTGVPAVAPIPSWVAESLDAMTLEPGFDDPDQPFRYSGSTYETGAGMWRKRLAQVFMIAGITEVLTEVGTTRNPHPHMFRDTCAIWYLQHGRSLEDVARILGHHTTRETEKSYAFWIKEREDAMIQRIRDTQEMAVQVVHKI